MSSVLCLVLALRVLPIHAETVGLLQSTSVISLDSEAGEIVDQKQESLLQKLEEVTLAPDQEACLAWNMSALQYEVELTWQGPAALDSAFKIFKKYEVSSVTDIDKAWLMQNGADCWMVFKGADASGNADDWVNLANTTPITKWGVGGLYAGIAVELAGLLALMDFTEIRAACPGKFTVVGHSMGGGLAQLFAALITNAADPLKAGLTLHKLWTFASVPPFVNSMNNEQTSGGCFPGRQFWYAQPAKSSADGYAVDAKLWTGPNGVGTFAPVKSDSAYVFTNGSEIAYPCGTSTADGVDLYKDAGLETYNWNHGRYSYHLNCYSR